MLYKMRTRRRFPVNKMKINTFLRLSLTWECRSLILCMCVSGSCGRDGLYWVNPSSFVICSHGYAYHQPCAPGTQHSGLYRYKAGYHYGEADFCDVNMIDGGLPLLHELGSQLSHRKDQEHEDKVATLAGREFYNIISNRYIYNNTIFLFCLHFRVIAHTSGEHLSKIKWLSNNLFCFLCCRRREKSRK